MILYRLQCSQHHEFEAWFRDAAAFDEQARQARQGRYDLSCPYCGDVQVTKAPMAPRIGKGREEQAREEQARAQAQAVVLAAQLAEVRQVVEENCEYVGDAFAEEARKIHYGEVDPRSIYGETNAAEAEALREEGVTFGLVPWLPRTHS